MKNLVIHLLQIVVNDWSIDREVSKRLSFPTGEDLGCVWVLGMLACKVDLYGLSALQSRSHSWLKPSLKLVESTYNIHSETIRTAFEPVMHHGPQRLSELHTFPVEIRLLLQESVQEVLLRCLVPLPSGTPEVFISSSYISLAAARLLGPD